MVIIALGISMLAAVDVKNDIPVTGFQGNGQSTAQKYYQGTFDRRTDRIPVRRLR